MSSPEKMPKGLDQWGLEPRPFRYGVQFPAWELMRDGGCPGGQFMGEVGWGAVNLHQFGLIVALVADRILSAAAMVD